MARRRRGDAGGGKGGKGEWAKGRPETLHARSSLHSSSLLVPPPRVIPLRVPHPSSPRLRVAPSPLRPFAASLPLPSASVCRPCYHSSGIREFCYLWNAVLE